MIQINFLFVMSFHILAFAIDRSQIKIQQCRTTLNIEFSTGNLILRRISRFGICLSGGGNEEKSVM